MSEFLKQLDEKVPDVETSIITEEQEETEPPKTMAELYNLLKQLGSAWRQDNAYIVNEGQKTSVQSPHSLTSLQLLTYWKTIVISLLLEMVK